MDPTKTNTSPAVLIAEAYKRTGFTRGEMARALGMGNNVVRDIERGAINPPTSILNAIRDVNRKEVPKCHD